MLHITYNNHLVAVLPPANVLFKRRIKTNSILIQSKMALPNMWFEKIFANGNRKCDRWFNTLQRQREKRMMRNWAAPSPTRAPSTSTCQDVKQRVLNLQIPHPLLKFQFKKKVEDFCKQKLFSPPASASLPGCSSQS